MAINEDVSFIEYNVEQPTQDFVTNFDTIGGTTDVVLVTVDGVPTDTPASSYTAQKINDTTWRVTPEVSVGSVVRVYRATDLDQMMYVFTAGAKFIARNMDDNFKQIRHAQQEVRDNFDKLKGDIGFTNLEETIEAVGQIYQAATLVDASVKEQVLIAQGIEDSIDLQVTTIQSYADTALAAKDAALVAEENATTAAVGLQTYVDAAVGAISTDASKQYATLALANADIANINLNQNVFISDAVDGGYWYKATAGATSLTKSAFDPVAQAKNHTDGYATVKSKTLANATDFNTLNVEGRYIVPSNAAALTMLNCPSTRAGVLEVLPVNVTLVIQRYTPYGIEKKSYIRAYNSSWNTWDELLFKGEALSLFATPAYVGSSVSSSLDAITQSDFYGKKYTESEQTGSSLYQNGVIVGLNSIYSKAITFNSVSARIFNSTNSVIEYRIWTGSKTVTGGNGYGVSGQATIGNPDFSGVVQSLPKSDTGAAQNIVLDKNISIPANTPFVIAFKAVDNTKFGIAYASSQAGNLEARSFNLSQLAADWSSQTAVGNATFASGYVQAGFKLLVEIPQSSSGAQPHTYIPELVLPPKLYALSGIETHIYPEHLLVEDYKLYEHDITCNRGQQRNRGFVWNATQTDPVGSYPLTWALQDKQKGLQLTSASTSIQLAALNAKSGQTVKALVIGDSLVNAGFITQRLLDIAVDDVMKVQLIGTRGTGLNKHEGRGGWKIADYATAGQSNYKFTVSGVTTTPAINSANYEFGGVTYRVQETSLTGGSGYLICSVFSGTPPASPSGSGTLVKNNIGVGDDTITFSNFEKVSANPFWNSTTSQLDFANYLSVNSLTTPDYVFIQLGVNDVFGLTSDQAVVDFTVTTFTQLDSIITAIKTAMPLAKIAVVAPPVGANQDAFGTSYGCGQTAWRYRRNLVTYNKQLYAHYAGKEAQSIYVLGSGVGVDTESNFPTTVKTINSHNSKTEDAQSNGVHPDKSGYDQLSDGLFPFMKAV